MAHKAKNIYYLAHCIESAHLWSVWMAPFGIVQCPDYTAVHGGTWPTCGLLEVALPCNFLFFHRISAFASLHGSEPRLCKQRAEFSFLGAFLLISPRTAFYSCSWLPPWPLPLFPSLCSPRTYEWRPLDPFCNKPWVTHLNRWTGFENNVKNCEMLPVRGAQPSFGQWIMALAKMFSLRSLVTSLEEWDLLPIKIGSFSASSSSMAPPPSMVVSLCTPPLCLCPPSPWATALSHSLGTWAWSEAHPCTRTRMIEVIAQLLPTLISLLFLTPYTCGFTSCLKWCIWPWGPMSRWTPAARMFQKTARVWPSVWTLFFWGMFEWIRVDRTLILNGISVYHRV